MGFAAGDEVDPSRELKDLGLDSLSAAQLLARLRDDSGEELPTTLLLDHPTAAALERYLRVRSTSRVSPESRGPSANTLAAMLIHARDGGELGDGLHELMRLSRFWPSFSEPRELGPARPLAALARGGVSPDLICIPSFMSHHGPHQFLRLARELDGHRTVSALGLPGFAPGDPLPASLPAVLAAVRDQVLAASAGRPFVLLGYSAGGLIAHAVAPLLVAAMSPPRGVALLDTTSLETATSASSKR